MTLRHMNAPRSLCEQPSAVTAVGHATTQIWCVVNCPICLRCSIAEAEERLRVLRDLLAKVAVAP